MMPRRRNFIVTAACLVLACLVETWFERNLQTIIERHGLHDVLETWLSLSPDLLRGVSENLGFWEGSFTVLALWGGFEASYAWRHRRRRSDDGKIGAETSSKIPDFTDVHKEQKPPSSIRIRKTYSAEKCIYLGRKSTSIQPNLSLGRHFSVELTGHAVLTQPLNPPPSGTMAVFTIEIIHDHKYTLSYEKCYDFNLGIFPELGPENSAVFRIHSGNGGDSWYIEKIR